MKLYSRHEFFVGHYFGIIFSSVYLFIFYIVIFNVIFKLFLKFYLFLAALVFVAARGLSLVAASGGYSLRCSGFPCCGARALGMRASVVVAHRLSSCGSRA